MEVIVVFNLISYTILLIPKLQENVSTNLSSLLWMFRQSPAQI